MKQFLQPDSDWEEVEAEDGELDKDLMYSAGVTSFGRPSHEHLEAMAKTFDKVLSCCWYILVKFLGILIECNIFRRMRRTVMKMIN